MTATFEAEHLSRAITAALETFRERQARAEDEADDDTLIGRYWAGRADTWADAAGLLAELLAVPVPRAAAGES